MNRERAYELSMTAADALGHMIGFLIHAFQRIDKPTWFLFGFTMAWVLLH
jgi:hypothetical protein